MRDDWDIFSEPPAEFDSAEGTDFDWSPEDDVDFDVDVWGDFDVAMERMGE